MNLQPFSYAETHRLGQRPGVKHSSGWTSLFASVQTETGVSGFFPPNENHLVVITLKQKVRFSGRIGGQARELILPPGSMTLTPAGADLQVDAGVDRGDYETVYLYLRHELLDELRAEMFGDGKEHALVPCIGVMDGMAQAIAEEIRKMLLKPANSDKFYAEALSRTLAAHLLRNHAGGEEDAGLTPQAVRCAMEYIERHIGEAMSVTGIAQAVGTSVATLAQAFKKASGCTVYEYVMRRKVDRAKQLLASTGLPLAEIAMQCGFSDQPHMNHILRRATGLTPGAIRRRG